MKPCLAPVSGVALPALLLTAGLAAAQDGTPAAAAASWTPLLTVLAVLAAGAFLAQTLLMLRLLRQRRLLLARESARLKRERSYRFLMERAQEGIATVNAAGVFTYANVFLGDMLGLPAKDLLGSQCLAFVHEKDRPAARSQLEKVLAGESVQYEGRFLKAGGEPGWMLVSAVPVRDDSGAVTGAFLLVHDLTARKHSEQAWRESEERYRALIQQAPEAIVVYDADTGLFVDANLHAQDLFGLSLEDFCASPPARIYQHEQPDGRPLAESLPENVNRALAGETVVLERAMKDTRGREFSCELRITPLPSACRRLLRGSYIDITERKRAEQALRLSEQRFKTIFEQAADAILVFGLDSVVTGANPAALELLGRPLEELLCMTYADLLETGQLEANPVDRGALHAGHTVRGERVFLSKDGRRIHADVSARLVDGEFAQVIVKDVTARKNLEKLREDVDRIIRHDLKTPLVGIQSLARQLVREPLSDMGRERLELLADSAERMMRMISFSLDLYKMETKTFELAPAEFDLMRVVRQVAAQMFPLAKGRGVEIAVELDGREAGPGASYPAFGDELLCLGMLENLLQNAVEASPRGARVQVRLDSSPRRLAIRNQGEVPQAIRQSFFDKYVTSGKAWGTGLGTYSAKLVADAHSWAIAVDCSAPGRTEVSLSCTRSRS